jgi:hypothetical protein
VKHGEGKVGDAATRKNNNSAVAVTRAGRSNETGPVSPAMCFWAGCLDNFTGICLDVTAFGFFKNPRTSSPITYQIVKI